MVMKPELTQYARDLEILHALKRMERGEGRGTSKGARKRKKQVGL
ncbi:hypothetical protein [Alicyclobacillus acidocaldarius]|uniref:Uncharacterized protein n=1 Tax=Alicyclobacillus acidocaldarius (strain Tc-4-1) TaxID=1048834 RepID=F8IHU4_ALIAT|nr:hypothetical protein [Alicyclobacillus acidocaldarius]AEJ43234.1 hypothetical protein TC41_1295 [Alicyclobacillus acidocaldarius subsp. acidocaldarius Tc-4-1]